MAGVLEQLLRPQKSFVVHCTSRMNPKELELQTAKEILAEVFMVRLSEVDEMIQNRFEKVSYEATCCEKDGLWPQEFWLEC
jgi:Sec7-like guanine-nucleotide exchange factor